jgi:hypothetical protein
VTDPEIQKRDERQALAAFVGYSSGQPHGVQIDNAKRKALAIVKGTGGTSAKDVRSAYASTAGYVAGSVDNATKQREDLMARERRSARAIAALEGLVRAATTTREESYRSRYLADLREATDKRFAQVVEGRASDAAALNAYLAVEEARLQSIRADLAALG